MPSSMKQIRLPVTSEQEAVIMQLADGSPFASYLRGLIEADAKRRGVAYPLLNNPHGGKRERK